MGNILNLLFDDLYEDKYRVPNGLDRFTKKKLMHKMKRWSEQNEFQKLNNSPMGDIQTNVKIGPFLSTDVCSNFEIKFYDVKKNIPMSRKYIYVIELLHQRGLYFSIMNIPDKVIDLVNEDKCKIIIDYEHEGQFDYEFFNRWYNELFQDLEQFIKLKNFYFFTGDLICNKFVNKECKINFFPSTHFVDNISVEVSKMLNENRTVDTELGYSFEVKNVKDINFSKKKKHFLSYMRNCSRIHRRCLASYYEYNKSWENNVVSFLKGDCNSDTFNKIPECLPKKYHKSHVQLRNRDVIEIDTFNNRNKFGFGTSYTDKWEFYQQTFLSVVTETLFNEGGIFISEKTVKPILNLHPFIIISTQGILSQLKSMGFKTFHPFIDESYDDEKDDKIRIKKVFEQLDKFSSRSNEELIEWSRQIVPILEHNQKTFINLSNNKSEKVKLLKSISSGQI